MPRALLTEEQKRENAKASRKKWVEQNKDKNNARRRKYRKQPHVREKERDALRQWSRVNKERTKHYVAKGRAKLKENTKIAKALFGNLCGFDGCRVADTRVMEFDHINPEEKRRSIAQMVTHSTDTFFQEVAKCQLLCSNHHYIKTKTVDFVANGPVPLKTQQHRTRLNEIKIARGGKCEANGCDVDDLRVLCFCFKTPRGDRQHISQKVCATDEELHAATEDCELRCRNCLLLAHIFGVPIDVYRDYTIPYTQ